jgi:glycosyltransferase involved in cell wall biosynthesis
MIRTVADAQSQQENPAVTVVIAAYNSAHYIGQTLDSVKAQTFTDYEVIVVNDGSHDRAELERIIDSHPLPIVYLSQENKGVSAARNAAIRFARGKFYAQIDADDQWTPDYLEVQLAVLNDNADVTLVYPNATIIGDGFDGTVEFMKISPSEGDVNFESLVRQKCVVMTCVTAHMSTIREAGMFDETLRSCEDFDLWLRIAKNGGRIVYHRRPLVLYRRHEGSLSSDRVWMTRHLLAVFEKCERTFQLTPSEKKLLDDQITENRALLNLFEGKHQLNARQTSAALESFQKANEHLRTSKLAVVIFLLRYAPRLVVWGFAARERLQARKPDHRLSGIDQPHTTSSPEILADSSTRKVLNESH